MNRKKFFKKIIRNKNNVKFSDFTNLIIGFGFSIDRIRGSHHIYKYKSGAIILNLQNVNGEVKPYQISQFLKIVEKNALELKDDS
ncbi:MAG: type II toxin-antitoxin system HicA family toxin [Calditrichaeota bacterium]|nr:MAG: type II toxin-antitoxin system HicA family toxin [Calditrichota bacterium]